MNNITNIVRGVIAEHAGRSPSHVRTWQHLESDLDLTPADLVLIGLEIEDAVDVELPPEGPLPLETVSDFIAFVTRAVADERRHQVLDRVA